MIRLARPATVAELVTIHGGELDAGLDPTTVIATVGSSDGDGDPDLAPVLHERGARRLGGARVWLVAAGVSSRVPAGQRWIHPRAEVVLARLLVLSSPDGEDGEDAEPFGLGAVHRDTLVEGRILSGARVGRDVSMGAGSVIEPNAVVFPGVVIGRDVTIGAGSVIGRPGFRFVEGPEGSLRMPHRAGVTIADGVEIGAACTIDAGILAPTRIGARTKLDAQVHVGHGVTIGARCRIAAQVGLAGSVIVEDDVWMGGQAGVADHCVIGRGARIAAKAGVIGDVPAGAVFAGYPAVDRARWLRGHARLYRTRR